MIPPKIWQSTEELESFEFQDLDMFLQCFKTNQLVTIKKKQARLACFFLMFIIYTTEHKIFAEVQRDFFNYATYIENVAIRLFKLKR